MRGVYTCVFLLLQFGLLNAQGLVTVQGSGDPSFYYSIQDAIDNAQDGDYIYVPGGGYHGDITINKRLHIIGAGLFPDSSLATGNTYLNGTVYVSAGADFGSVEGLYIQEDIKMGNTLGAAVVRNYMVRRCLFRGLYTYPGTGGTPFASNNSITECIVRGDPSTSFIVAIQAGGAGNSENWDISNSIFYDDIDRIFNSTFRNNILIDSTFSQSLEATESIFYNNIFISYCRLSCNINQSPGNQFYNNVFVYDQASVFNSTGVDATTCNSVYNNIYEIAPEDLFQNWNGNTYHLNDDFRLKSGSPAIGYGINGTDCGIYGGGNSWKNGSIPHNPHIQFKSIGTSTTPEGDLEINIRVKAQDE